MKGRAVPHPRDGKNVDGVLGLGQQVIGTSVLWVLPEAILFFNSPRQFTFWPIVSQYLVTARGGRGSKEAGPPEAASVVLRHSLLAPAQHPDS